MSDLNKEQYRASRPDGGVNLILAGAGTGKTRTLVEKAANVIRELPLKPEEILLLTFSRRAAEELRERVASHDGVGRAIAAGTFHSFCYELLRRNNGAFMDAGGFSRFPSVIEDDGRRKIFHDLICRDLDRFLGLPAGVVYDLAMKLDSIGGWKRKKLEESGIHNELMTLAEQYRDIKRQRDLIDYDDMMMFAIDLLEKNDEVRAGVHGQYRYVFVDEFQDVSDENIRLLKKILPDRNPDLCAVGDDWQSIYGFRGADIGHIMGMKKHFPGTVIHRLTVNYRSRKEIITLAGRLIRNNRRRTRKGLRSFRGKGGLVRLHTVADFDEEADVVRKILAARDWGGTTAVLYRNNWQGRYLRERCAMEGAEAVSFMTMHGSKGLEFDRVVIAGVSDAVLPDADNDIEEERRLLFVACTRARDELHVIVHINDDGEVSGFGRELGASGERK